MKLLKVYLGLVIFAVSCNNKELHPSEISNMKISYTADGKINRIEIMTDTSSVAQEISFYKDGSIESVLKNNDSSNTQQRIWFYQNGGVENTTYFKNGKANGNSFIFFGDGAIKNHRYWHDDKIVGYSTNYFQDSIGTLKNIFFYNNDGKMVSGQDAPEHSKGISVTNEIPH
jgi:antitoxin component YwqK of YwqJK toxin-antitoxin module